MEEIKKGDFVYHEKYGKGMCIGFTDWDEDIRILFENSCTEHQFLPSSRKSLFKKGDLVEGFYDSDYLPLGTFIGWSDFSQTRNEDYLIIKGKFLKFVKSIKHQEEKTEISLTLEVNGKQVSPSTLSEETWRNLRGKLK